MAAGSNPKVQQARSLCDEARWADVLTLARRWQAETTDDAQAFFYEGVALAGLGKFVAAETAYYRALGLDAQDFTTWNNLASLLFNSLLFDSLLSIRYGRFVTTIRRAPRRPVFSAGLRGR